jgi:hypothetical protein
MIKALHMTMVAVTPEEAGVRSAFFPAALLWGIP